ncbi:MAG: haloacid dehalogenase type II [Gimesia sp.]|jgi:2-haloacid dehalogenase|uniref:Haloacid dehalogenase type II n=1 Tax=Gimesia maris TaxID=122 RepID=A0A3D3QZ29_9PLAN|nr:haloacid dehalogenase type II [Gimesia sp.]HCO21739.1 haloacid dehalogenase type II [Gimesia maris]|tara:strand:+ start:2211 stop:3041 length:831 start_codon:yes stop_codon:yes gene_type:complete
MTSAPGPDSASNTASSRRNFLTATAGIAAGLLPATLSAEEPTMPSVSTRPKCLFFDVNETLLDLDAMKQSVAAALGGRPDLLPLWFTTMLQHSLVATVGDHYDDFGVIGAATLQMVARNHDIDLSDDAAKQALAPIRSLPAHPDVRPALEQLKEAGYRMVTLTNSSQAGVDAQMKNAGLTDLFEDRLSVEDVQMFKPHSHVYKWASRKMNVPPEDCMLIAAHGWDIAGALWAGWRGAFVARPGAQLYPLAKQPEINKPDIKQVAAELLQLGGECCS